MARPKLRAEQREILLQWLAAEYDTALIRIWFRERGWPELSRRAFTHYRKRYGIQIQELRSARRTAAVTTGLALREERIERLKLHADQLEAIKWLPDEKGRLWNEKAWRETLADLAAELGDRKQRIEHSGSIKLEALTDEELEQLERLSKKLAIS